MGILDNIRVPRSDERSLRSLRDPALALLGAEVIKIENPDGGDLARKLGNVPGSTRI